MEEQCIQEVPLQSIHSLPKLWTILMIVSRDATIRVNTILRIALKSIAIFGLGPLAILKCYACVNNSWI